MKKHSVTLVMLAALVAGAAACTPKPSGQTTAAQTAEQTTAAQTAEQTTAADTSEQQSSEAETGSEPISSAGETETEASSTQAAAEASSTIENQSQEQSSGEQEKTRLQELLAQIYEKKSPAFRQMETAVDLTDEVMFPYYTGLTMQDTEKIAEAYASEPMMSSQAYSLVLVQVKDKADAAELAQKMADGVNPRKWICVGADDLQAVTKDDTIMLIMVSSQLKLTSGDMTDAFEAVLGKADGFYSRK